MPHTDTHEGSHWPLIGVLVFAVLALGFGGYQVYRAQQADVTARREAELGVIAGLKAGQIAEWRAERLADARGIAGDPLFARALDGWLAQAAEPTLGAAVAKRLELARDTFGYQNVLLASADGESLLSLEPGFEGFDPAARQLIARAAASGEAGFGEPTRGAGSRDAVSLDIAAPVFDGSRRVIAVLVLRVLAQRRLYPLLAFWPTGSPSAETLLVRRDDQAVVFLNPLRHSRALPLEVRRDFASKDLVGARAARGEVGIVRGRDYRDVEVIADLRPIPGTDWFMVAKVDAKEILAEARYRGVVILTVTGTAMVAVALLIAAVAALQRKNRYQSLFAAERRRAELLDEFRATLDSIGDGVLSTDAGGRIRRMNPMAVRLTGWSAAQAVGRPVDEVFSIIDEQTRTATPSPVHRALHEGVRVGLERPAVLVSRDGVERPVGDSGAPIRDASGATIGAVLVFRDRSAERAAELALRDSERFLRSVLDAVPAHLAIIDGAGKIVEVNRSWRRFASEHGGPTAGLCEGANYLEVCDRVVGAEATAAHRFSAGVREVIAGQRMAFELEYACHGPGEQRWFVAQVSRFTGEGPVRVVISHTDISTLRRSEDTLKKLSLAVEQSSEGILITDDNARIDYANDALLKISGYSREELLGRDPRLLGANVAPASLYGEMMATLAEGEPWRGEFPCRRRNGEEYTASAVISPIRDVDGKIVNYVAVMDDVTERRRVYEELDRHRLHLQELVDARTVQLSAAMQRAEAASQAKSAFLANMSHEIRTPMNGVLGMVDVLAQTRLSARQTEIVRTIHESGVTLLRLIDEVLDFSKIEAERLELEHAPFDPAEVVERVTDSLSAGAVRSAVDLSVFVAPDVPARIVGDALRLRQILYNLVGNAVKFSAGRGEQRGRVRVRLDAPGGAAPWLRITVDDNGEGMSEEVRRRLFVPFTQGETATTRRFGGTGLGLTITKRLVDLMEGEIEIASSPGAGATFTVLLPMEAAAEQPPREALAQLDGLGCIVTDIPEVDVDGVCTYLSHAGARVLRTDDLEAAEALARTQSLATVIIHRATAGQFAQARVQQARNVDHLLITRGRRRKPRLERPGVASLDAAAVRRATLLRAVAMAAGRVATEPTLVRAEQVTVPLASSLPLVTRRQDRGRWILVAEDDEISREVIGQQLDLLGYPARIAPNGERALALWREGGYDALITDLHMPEMDGYTLAEAIRREEGRRAGGGASVPRTPILALTANALRGEAERAKAVGIDEYLTKPVQLARLSEMLERLMRARDGAPGPSEPLAAGAAASDPAPASPAIDVAALRALVGESPQVIRTLLESFQQTLEQQGADLLAACERGELDEGRSLAHRLKSSSRSVGALVLSELCSEIEARASLGRAVTAARRRALAEEIDRVGAALRGALAAHASDGRRESE